MEETTSRRKFSARGILLNRRTRKIAIWSVSVVVAFGILGGLVAPYILKRVLPGRLSEMLHRDVTIEQIQINPFAMTATIRRLLVKERQSAAPAISFDELYANLEIESLLRFGPVLKEIRIVKPYVSIVRGEDNKYNYQDLIDEFTSGPPSSGPTPRFALNNIEVVEGRIDFEDKPEQIKHQITELQIGLPLISSLPSLVDIFVKPELSALVNGAPLRLGGESKPFHESLESAFQMEIKEISVPKYLEYSPVKLNFTMPSGQISAKLSATFKKQPKSETRVFTIFGDVALRNLVIKGMNGEPLLNLPALDLEIDAYDIFAKKASIKSIKAGSLDLFLHRQADGGFNLVNLVATGEQSEPSQSPSNTKPDSSEAGDPFTFRLDEVLLESGTLHFDDETTKRPYKTRLANVRINAKGLTNEPEKKAAVEIAFETDANERFMHNGTLQLTPLLIEGKLEIEGLRPAGFQPYYQDLLAAEIREGFFDLSTRYLFQSKQQGSGLKFTDMAAAVRNLIVEETDKKPLWRIPSLTVKDVAVDIDEKSILIGAVEGSKGSGFLQLNADGTLNYSRLVKARPPDASPQTQPANEKSATTSIEGASEARVAQLPSASTPANGIVKEADRNEEPGWKFEAKRIALDAFNIAFEDNTPRIPVKFSLSDLSVRGEQVSNIKNQRGQLAIETKIKDGQLSLTGTAGANPVVANLTVEGRDLDLLTFRPYLENQINFVLTGGRMGAKGEILFDGSEPGPAKIGYTGDLSVSDFATIDKSVEIQDIQDLLKWKLLTLGGINFALNPTRISINEIDLAGFYSRIIISPDGKINLQNLTVDGDEKKAAQGAEPSTTAVSRPGDRQISIGKITLRDGNINFSDFFVKPNYSANLTSVQGAISEIKPGVAAELGLEAKLDKAAPVDIRGKIDPLAKELFMDIKAKASGIELSPFSPYSGKYVGYGIEKGKLTFNVEYKLDNRKLDAQTQFVLDQLTFGEKVESPTAMNLPVKLAVALLKDRNGVIDIGLPISGSLDNPEFSIGGVVWRLIGNIITRAITAPFALLGAAFGGGEADLSYIDFEYGRAALSQTAEDKIKTLVTAMNERSVLNLEITGHFDPAADLEGLKRVSIERKVKAQKFKELTRRGTAPKSIDDVEVSKDEYERYLRAAYNEETFPKPRNIIGLAKSLPVPEMENLMLKHTRISDEALRELADRRAQTVRDRLLAGQIPAERLSIVAAKPLTKEAQEKPKAKASRVDFSLR